MYINFFYFSTKLLDGMQKINNNCLHKRKCHHDLLLHLILFLMQSLHLLRINQTISKWQILYSKNRIFHKTMGNKTKYGKIKGM